MSKQKKKKHKRKRNVIWFNPPFCRTVKTKIARNFILLIKKHFHKTNPLKKIFNRNTINLSYSCMQNIDKIINSHNRKILQNKRPEDNIKACNCRKFKCPLEGTNRSCRTESVIYKATVKTKDDTKLYIGLTGNEFKNRYYKHRSDFAMIKNKDNTELSKYIWKLKSNKTDYDISWQIIKTVGKLQNGNKICRLCIAEAMEIMKNRKGQLNKRSEILNKCRHKNKFLLSNCKIKDK